MPEIPVIYFVEEGNGHACSFKEVSPYIICGGHIWNYKCDANDPTMLLFICPPPLIYKL